MTHIKNKSLVLVDALAHKVRRLLLSAYILLLALTAQPQCVDAQMFAAPPTSNTQLASSQASTIQQSKIGNQQFNTMNALSSQHLTARDTPIPLNTTSQNPSLIASLTPIGPLAYTVPPPTLTARLMDDNVDIPPARRTPVPCTEAETDDLPWLDRAHFRLSQTLCNKVRRFDQFFGDVNYDEQYNNSFMRIRNSIAWENNTSTEIKFRPRIKANIRLPNAENKLNVIIADDSNDPDTLSSANEVIPETEENKNNVSTALRWVAKKKRALELNLDVGVRLNNGINSFVRARYRKNLIMDHNHNLRFTETTYWRDGEGFGERTQIDIEKLLKPHLVARWTNAATFSESTNGVAWTQRVTLFRQIDPLRAIAYNLGVLGETRPVPVVQNYGLSIRYRRNIYSHWLYAEVEPELNWPLETDREVAPAITLRLEIQLGRSEEERY